MLLERLLALVLGVVGAASLPIQTASPKSLPPSTIPPVVWAFYRERLNATDNYTVSLYTNKAVGSEAQCGVLQFNPEVPDSLKKAILRLHLRPESADGSAVRSKGYQVRLCSTCDLGWCHEFAKRILRPRAKMLEIEVPEEVLKTKEGLHVRLSVFAKGKAGGDTARKQLPCDTAAVQFVTNDTQSVLAPVLLVYKESSPTYLRDLLG